MEIHLVFHIYLLEQYYVSTILGKILRPIPPPIEINNELEYEVEEVLDSRFKKKRLEYLVHWKGCDFTKRTWEPAIHLVNACEKLQYFTKNILTSPKSLLIELVAKEGGNGTDYSSKRHI